jgi:primosomal replication protein N
MFDNNHFVCKGKLSGRYNRRATPGGVILEEALIAVPTKTPWKQKRIMHIQVTCWGDLVDRLQGFKTGDEIKVTGFIEQTGKSDKKEFSLMATQIEKEK